jgi:hypothetical protein
VNSELEQAYIDSLNQQIFPGPEMDVAGTVRPGAMQGEMKSIEQSPFEALMEKTGATLEEIGMALDGLGKVSIGGIELGIRDFLPFVGGSEKELDPLTGEQRVVQVGTPEALQMAGRGESLVRGAGFATQLVPDAKLAAFDVPTAGALVKSTTKVAGNVGRDIGREMATTPPTGAVQLAPTPVQAPRSELGFYSAVEETVANLPQAKGTGQQFLAQISKTAGVKPEEIQWTGLDEFLKGKKSVTKQEVQDYLAANRVDVQEVRLDRTPAMVGAERNAAYDAYDRGEITLEQRNEILERSDPTNTRHHLGAYQGIKTEIPGGENYRELLLTLPQRTAPFDPSNVKIYRNRTSATQGTFSIKYGDNAAGPFPDEFNVADDYAGLSDQQIMDIAKRMYEQGNELSGIKPMSGAFKSTHFNQPNILAHLRVNDRAVDGKKTLFVEEIQSDWHQAGRKKGYQREKDLTPEQIDLKFIQSEIPPGADPSVYPGYYEAFDKNTGQFLGRHSGTLNREQAMRDAVMSANQFQTGVPNAPFKTSWHELSLKRAIQEAAEKGYDQIAFTTGKTQAERYDLSKQVDYIDYVKEGEDNYLLAVVGKDGQGINLPKETFTAAELENYVGKDVAQRIVKGEGQAGGGRTTLRGPNLQVGGGGMKGFYDNILPKSLDKLGKKFDAKVTKTTMKAGESSLQPSMVRTETGTELRATAKAAPEVEIWKMDITPKMRESVVSKGQPLFVAPIVAPGMMQEEETK